MDTKRCAHCHKLLRVDTQICSRCGHPTGGKQRKASLKETIYPSIPPASPHRVGHYSGLHPEDQPYQSTFIAVQRPAQQVEEMVDDEDGGEREATEDALYTNSPRIPRAKESKEPERILLPHVSPFIEDVPTHIQPRAEIEQEYRTTERYRAADRLPGLGTSQRVPRTRKLTPAQLDFPEYPQQGQVQSERHFEQPIPVPAYIGSTRPTRASRLIPLLLTLSVIFFLLASGLLAFVFVKRNAVLASPVLEANPATLRVNDTFVLTGSDFDANSAIAFTHDAKNEAVVDVKQQPMSATTDSKGNFSVQIVVPATWEPGEHAIHATDNAQELSRTTTITVQRPPSTPPQLQLMTSTLNLGEDRAGTTRSSQVTLVNAGGGQVSWQAQSDSAWLTATPTDNKYTFSGSSLVNVTVNRSHLLPKTYTGHITFSQHDSTNTAKLTVTMAVKAAPAALNVAPSSLTFSASNTQTVPVQAITLQNSGGQTLDWQASAKTNDGANWLYVNQTSGHIARGASQMLDVTVQAQQLAVGSYQGTIVLSGGASASLPVFLTVVAPGTLVVSPTSLTFDASTGQNTAGKPITLQNTGGQSLNWSASVMGDGTNNWLSISPANGTIAQSSETTISVAVNSAALKAGTYQGTIVINSGGTATSIPVSLAITTPPAAVISIQSTSLAFTTTQGNDPFPQDFTVTNTGSATLNWVATESGNGATFAPLSLSSGSLAPQTSAIISVAPTVASDAAATLATTITIADSDPGTTVASQKLPVTVAIQSEAAIGIDQTNFSLDTTHTTQTVAITNSGTATLNWIASIYADTPASATSGTTISGTGTPASGSTPISASSSWLSVDVGHGTLTAGQSQTIHLIANTKNLKPGIYQGQITISDSDVGTVVGSRVLYVTLTV